MYVCGGCDGAGGTTGSCLSAGVAVPERPVLRSRRLSRDGERGRDFERRCVEFSRFGDRALLRIVLEPVFTPFVFAFALALALALVPL